MPGSEYHTAPPTKTSTQCNTYCKFLLFLLFCKAFNYYCITHQTQTGMVLHSSKNGTGILNFVIFTIITRRYHSHHYHLQNCNCKHNCTFRTHMCRTKQAENIQLCYTSPYCLTVQLQIMGVRSLQEGGWIELVNR